ncbi:hypothetical protein AX14_001446 [Amanita brunnescens Koide BX004]|nr:hypothetical protein AX14_001446 [Amanita brunnescens Koide BX004]
MARLNYTFQPERPINAPLHRKGWRSAKRNSMAPDGVSASAAIAYRKRVREDIRARIRGHAAASDVDMDVDPDQWPDQIPTWSIFHPDNRPRPFFNGVSQSGGPPTPTEPVQPVAPAYQLPVAVDIPHTPRQYMDTDVIMFEDDYVEPPPVITGYAHMAHREYVEGFPLRPEVTNAVPLITGYAPEYSEDMEVDAEGPLIAPQALDNYYPPHSGATAIPGNPIIFPGPGIDDIPYDPNEPYFNARPQVVPPDALATAGVIPYDPNAPYFNAGPQVGIAEMHNPIFNVNPPYHAPQAVVDDHLFRINANLPPTGHLPFPGYDGFVGIAQDEMLPARNYVVQPPAPQEPIVPIVAREAEQAVEAGRPGDRAELFAELFGDEDEEDDGEDDETANAPVWGAPWPGGNEDDEDEDEDDDELEIYTGM